MRALKYLALGLVLLASCGEDTGLLDLTLAADAQNPPAQAATVDLLGSGEIDWSYIAKFPPDGASSLRVEYPNLPARTITFSVQTLDSRGCVLGESAAPFVVAIKAGHKVTATTTIQRSSKPCGDGSTADVGPDGGDGSSGADGRAPDRADGSGLADAARDSNSADPSLDGSSRNPVFDGASESRPANETGSSEAPSMPLDVSTADSAPPGDGTAIASSLDAFPTAVDGPRPFDALESGADLPETGVDAPLPSGPVIVSFTARPATISVGSATTLTAVFRNATGSSVDHGIGSITSGNGVSTGPLKITTTYNLTVTDASGNSASQSVTVKVVALPAITSFTALLPTIAVGTLTQLTAVFTEGTGTIDNDVGAVNSNTPAATPVLLATTTFTLTVTNEAGDATSKTATVTTTSAVGPGTFTPTGPMTVGRACHTATLLPTGKVLVAGGTGNTMLTAELYDPDTGTFSPTGPMVVGRTFHSAIQLRNGKVLLAGGDEAGATRSQASTVEVFDPWAGTFTVAGKLATNRSGSHVASLLPTDTALFAGEDYVVGGSTYAQSSSAEIYDPTKASSIPTGSMRYGRQAATATLLPDGHVLVAGGYGAAGGPTPESLSTAELFDPATGSFARTVEDLMFARSQHTATLLLNGTVLLVGGTFGTDTNGSDLYNPASRTFSATGPTSDFRQFHTATLLPNGDVLVAGGAGSLPSGEVYDVTTGKFTLQGDMSAPRERHAATLLPNGRVLVTGGDTSATSSSAELFW